MLSRNKLSKFISEMQGVQSVTTDGKDTVAVTMKNGNKAFFSVRKYATIDTWKEVIEKDITELNKTKVVKNDDKNKKA